jgi:hypothetical protein
MPAPRRDDDDVLRALEDLSTSAQKRTAPKVPPTPGGAAPQTAPAPKVSENAPPPAARKPPPPPEPPRPAQPDPTPGRAAEEGDAAPLKLAPPTPRLPTSSFLPLATPAATPAEDGAWRCLHCGYPLMGTEPLRCNECGRTYDRGDLEYFFGGDEQQRFDMVIWLVVSNLFLRLVVLPHLLWLGRAGAALVVAWACHVAGRGKPEGAGRYYGIAGTICGVLMLLFFSHPGQSLPYFTLDIIAGCALLLSMLHTHDGRRIAGVMLTGRVAPLIIFLAPVFALGCHLMSQVPEAVAPFTGPVFELFPPYRAVAPALAAAAVWVLAWFTLAGARRMFFHRKEELD